MFAAMPVKPWVFATPFVLLSACTRPTAHAPVPIRVEHNIIPAPATYEPLQGDSFTLATHAIIVAQPGEAERIGRYLADLIGTTRESTPLVVSAPDTTRSVIELTIAPGSALAAEGYELTVTAERVRLTAPTPAGLFYGVQTLRQLLPHSVEYTAALPRAMKIAAARVVDSPRYEWRGAHLDVARHFFGVSEVQRYIDILAAYKLNRLHLHLTDDQGWRIEIPGWPKLTEIGGSTQVGGKGGGHYTQAQYRQIVDYARDRFVTIVPEIDMPGHVNAAMASYPELNCDSIARPPFTGIEVGFSVLCVDKEVTYKFIGDVVAAVSAMTPGDYYHMGGDEVKKLGRERYNQFVERIQTIIAASGKRMIGWSEIAMANLPGSVIVQSWIPDSAHIAVARGSKVILSPASRIYLDMQYDSTTPIGLHWAAYVNLQRAYEWEPAQFNPKLPESAILGLEAPLWTETIGTMSDAEYMVLPRLSAVAELAWSQPARRSWPHFTERVRAHEKRWTALGWNYNPEGTKW